MTRKSISLVIAAVLAACGTGATPASTTTPGISASPTVKPSPTPLMSGGVLVCIEGQPYPAGRQLMTEDSTLLGFPLAITMTDGWTGCGLHYKELGDPGGIMMIGTWDVANVYRNPCTWKTSLPTVPVGSTVDDLVTALVDQEITDATKPSDVELDGYRGKYLRLSVPAGFKSTCDRDVNSTVEEFRFLNGQGDAVWWLGAGDATGIVGDVWVLDVGGKRVLIQAASFADAGEARREELKGIIGSIDFMP